MGSVETSTTRRAQALDRLRRLRDCELRSPRDSTPARVAYRQANDPMYPPAPPPLSYEEALRAEEAAPANERSLIAEGIRLSQEVVTGEWRRQLMQWLPEVTSHTTTLLQRQALDGWHPTGTGTLVAARGLLTEDGFTPVHDIASDRRGWPVWQREVWLHPEGLLGVIYARLPDPARTESNGEPVVEQIRVFYQGELVDEGLLIAAVAPGSTWNREPERGLIVVHGSFTAYPHYHGSLRVRLAVLRACLDLITPWRHPVHVGFGPDAETTAERTAILSELPNQVYELLGPMLLPT
ncbi:MULTISPECIES: hypothetical protein [unclassified Crossiella]|uniref:hypothetical protein n=1 Tax=unclassified Crossiella TaxID=2620835 RepID=UPI001FFF50F1|nr:MULTISPECIES: hypothetical protein [unclassified Crossiella]MCK2240097.1 hypothetical protein [Crossiella sp. S99.2]MCK2252806.1 hypothetical protein [Crossiella sp. S99.1]